MKERKIPVETFKKYGRLFAEGKIKDEYAMELAALFFLMAADIEFHEKLSEDWGDWWDGPMH